MFERLPYRVMALHGGVIVGGDIYIQMTFNSAPLTSHDTMWERTIRTPNPPYTTVLPYRTHSPGRTTGTARPLLPAIVQLYSYSAFPHRCSRRSTVA